MFKNGTLDAFSKYVLVFALGVGGTVAATYNTFETKSAHETDVLRAEKQRQNDRDELFDRLQRMEDKIDRLGLPHTKMPTPNPEWEGWGHPPLPPKSGG